MYAIIVYVLACICFDMKHQFNNLYIPLFSLSLSFSLPPSLSLLHCSLFALTQLLVVIVYLNMVVIVHQSVTHNSRQLYEFILFIVLIIGNGQKIFVSTVHNHNAGVLTTLASVIHI